MKRIIYYDMPTNFSKFTEEYEFINTEDIVTFTTDHLLITGQWMLNNYKYFTIEQWAHNALYNKNIINSRSYEIHNKIAFITCANSFINNNKIKLFAQAIEVDNTNDTFQTVYKSFTHWLRSCHYSIYKRMIQIKMMYSSFFLSEICEFIRCPYVISSNTFFINWNAFQQFQTNYNIQLFNLELLTFNGFEHDFYRQKQTISLKQLAVYHEDLYIHNSICYNEVPNGCLYYIKRIFITSESPTKNIINAYIKRRPYTKVYDQYMSDILQLKPPSSIYSIMSSRVYKQIEDYGISQNVLSNIKIENDMLTYNNIHIIFYYKAYQITNYKIKFSQNNIYEFYAYNMTTHIVELIKMRKLPPTTYEVIEIIY